MTQWCRYKSSKRPKIQPCFITFSSGPTLREMKLTSDMHGKLCAHGIGKSQFCCCKVSEMYFSGKFFFFISLLFLMQRLHSKICRSLNQMPWNDFEWTHTSAKEILNRNSPRSSHKINCSLVPLNNHICLHYYIPSLIMQQGCRIKSHLLHFIVLLLLCSGIAPPPPQFANCS